MRRNRIGLIGAIATMFGFAQKAEITHPPRNKMNFDPDINQKRFATRPRDDWDFDKPLPHHFSSKGGRKIFTINGKEIVSYSRKAAERKYRKKYGMF